MNRAAALTSAPGSAATAAVQTLRAAATAQHLATVGRGLSCKGSVLQSLGSDATQARASPRRVHVDGRARLRPGDLLGRGALRRGAGAGAGALRRSPAALRGLQ